jgi:hypothetical protein
LTWLKARHCQPQLRLCRHSDVGGFWRIEAEVALAARLDRGFTRVAAHRGRAAAGAIEHGIELAYLRACTAFTVLSVSRMSKRRSVQARSEAE